MTVYTSHRGNNANLIADVLALHPAKDVLDMTWGRGRFWTQADLTGVNLTGVDIDATRGESMPDGVVFQHADFRDLPFDDASFDLTVLDPPYVHSPTKFHLDGAFNNDTTTRGLDHRGIIQLYRDGMIEAVRLLRSGGQLWVKCQDTIEWSRQQWSHIEVFEIAREMDLYARDLFVLTPDSKPRETRTDIGTGEQRHGRRNHSYLWVFEMTKNTVPIRQATNREARQAVAEHVAALTPDQQRDLYLAFRADPISTVAAHAPEGLVPAFGAYMRAWMEVAA